MQKTLKMFKKPLAAQGKMLDPRGAVVDRPKAPAATPSATPAPAVSAPAPRAPAVAKKKRPLGANILRSAVSRRSMLTGSFKGIQDKSGTLG